MTRTVFITVIVAFANIVFIANTAVANDVIKNIVASKANEICPQHRLISAETCTALIVSLIESAGNEEVSLEGVRTELLKNANVTADINSLIKKTITGNSPLTLEFKAFDSDAGEMVLGLEYALDYNFHRQSLSSSKKWRRALSGHLFAEGTVIQDAEFNPRNLIDTRISYAASWTTKIPVQSKTFGQQLTTAAFQAAQCDGGPITEACRAADKQATSLLDSTLSFLKSFNRFQISFDGGLESDQKFEAKQTKFGLFAFAQRESWGGRGFPGIPGLTPTMRIGFDRVMPNNDTPRALAGDKSDFDRVIGEFSVWLPLQQRYEGQSLSLGYNLRYAEELDPSNTIKNAGLDSYILRTVSIAGSNGIFITYSSGKLPFDFQESDVVELGWKTAF